MPLPQGFCNIEFRSSVFDCQGCDKQSQADEIQEENNTSASDSQSATDTQEKHQNQQIVKTQQVEDLTVRTTKQEDSEGSTKTGVPERVISESQENITDTYGLYRKMADVPSQTDVDTPVPEEQTSDSSKPAHIPTDTLASFNVAQSLGDQNRVDDSQKQALNDQGLSTQTDTQTQIAQTPTELHPDDDGTVNPGAGDPLPPPNDNSDTAQKSSVQEVLERAQQALQTASKSHGKSNPKPPGPVKTVSHAHLPSLNQASVFPQPKMEDSAKPGLDPKVSGSYTGHLSFTVGVVNINLIPQPSPAASRSESNFFEATDSAPTLSLNQNPRHEVTKVTKMPYNEDLDFWQKLVLMGLVLVVMFGTAFAVLLLRGYVYHDGPFGHKFRVEQNVRDAAQP